MGCCGGLVAHIAAPNRLRMPTAYCSDQSIGDGDAEPCRIRMFNACQGIRVHHGYREGKATKPADI